jgi:hypothetical protein
MRDELRQLLDGEAEQTRGGFHCATKTRLLFVPYAMATDAAAALLICHERGLLKEKLEAMDRGAAQVLYEVTLAAALPEN